MPKKTKKKVKKIKMNLAKRVYFQNILLVFMAFIIVLLLAVLLSGERYRLPILESPKEISDGSRLLENPSPDLNIEKYDFPNENEGTLMIKTNLVITDDMKKHSALLLFESKVIPGLNILYDINNELLIGGLPIMVAEQKSVFDGNNHVIIYTFKKGGEQVLFFDNQLLIKSEFTGKDISSPLTGADVYDTIAVEDVEIEFFGEGMEIE